VSNFRGKEFPRWVFHPKHAPDGRICNSEEEAASLGRGWVDSKADFPAPSKAATWLKDEFKPWWNEWKWIISPTVYLAVFLAALGKLILQFFGFLP
jgi:hypothetical protein